MDNFDRGLLGAAVCIGYISFVSWLLGLSVAAGIWSSAGIALSVVSRHLWSRWRSDD